MTAESIHPSPTALTGRGRMAILICVFLGWMFAGMEMSMMVPVTRPAIEDFLTQTSHDASDPAAWAVQVATMADKWLSWFIASFLLGAALGGLVFGSLADRAGRAVAMGLSILCYSLVTGLSYFARSPEQLLVLRFLACLGIGGMWPAGVALATEAWPSVSRPALAGFIGAAANVGFLLLGVVMFYQPITVESWRWVLLLGALPALLGVAVLWWVPESPRWLASREQARTVSPAAEIFRPAWLRITVLGIAMGTIPLLGGWASGQRLIPWAGQADPAGLSQLKAMTQMVWATGAVIGSLLGGWVASRLGVRLSYFLLSLGSLLLSQFIFLALTPTATLFPAAAFLLGLVATSFFGWLPFVLPQLFPTPLRATGTGVAYNFGRIFSAVALLSTTALSELFRGDIARMGAATSYIYAFGLLLAWFIPRVETRD